MKDQIKNSVLVKQQKKNVFNCLKKNKLLTSSIKLILKSFNKSYQKLKKQNLIINKSLYIFILSS